MRGLNSHVQNGLSNAKPMLLAGKMMGFAAFSPFYALGTRLVPIRNGVSSITGKC